MKLIDTLENAKNLKSQMKPVFWDLSFYSGSFDSESIDIFEDAPETHSNQQLCAMILTRTQWEENKDLFIEMEKRSEIHFIIKGEFKEEELKEISCASISAVIIDPESVDVFLLQYYYEILIESNILLMCPIDSIAHIEKIIETDVQVYIIQQTKEEEVLKLLNHSPRRVFTLLDENKEESYSVKTMEIFNGVIKAN